MGYHIAKAYTGRGYATEAVRAFLPAMAKKRRVNQVYGVCLAENRASAKVMEKCGFAPLFRGLGPYQGEEREIVKTVWRPFSIREAALNETVMAALIRLSADWENEGSCYGYRKNEKKDIEGNRVFVAEDRGEIVGYLFGHVTKSRMQTSIMPDGTPFFEAEEMYVKPERRSQGIGRSLFAFAEDAVKAEADFILLSTATKNWRAVFHFYLDELDMAFWSARLFKKIKKTPGE